MDGSLRILEVAAARANFLASGCVPDGTVTDVVTASWMRSSASGVDVGGTEFTYTEDLDIASRLVRCAEPVLDRLVAEMADLPLTLVLTDNRARILVRRDTSPRLGVLLDGISMVQGIGYEEGLQGTNGIGTAIASGLPVHIRGPEHFHERFQPFACAGAPIRDPMTGSIEGVLDLTCLRENSSPLMASLVRSAAVNIEQLLFHDRNLRQRAVFDAFTRRDSRSHHAVFAVTDSLVIAGALAHTVFTAEEHRIIQAHAAYRMTGGKPVTETVEMGEGKLIRVQSEPIVFNEEPIGVVLEAAPLPTRPSQSLGLPEDVQKTLRQSRRHRGTSNRRPSQLLPAVRTSASPALRTVTQTFSTLMAARKSVLVTGEPGTGKHFFIREIFGCLHEHGTSAVFTAQDLNTPDGVGYDVEMMLNAVQSTEILFVFRQLEELTPEGAERMTGLIDRLRRLRPDVLIAGTMRLGPTGVDDVPDSVLACFDDSINIPSLRHRAEDIPQLAAQILANVANCRRLSITTEAVRQLLRYSWPRNVAELEEVIRFAVSRRPAGDIRVEDLPAECFRSAKRTLTTMEVAERDAIVAALHEHSGNRLKAAQHLGISRSSLYRKLESYGIQYAP